MVDEQGKDALRQNYFLLEYEQDEIINEIQKLSNTSLLEVLQYDWVNESPSSQILENMSLIH